MKGVRGCRIGARVDLCFPEGLHRRPTGNDSFVERLSEIGGGGAHGPQSRENLRGAGGLKGPSQSEQPFSLEQGALDGFSRGQYN